MNDVKLVSYYLENGSYVTMMKRPDGTMYRRTITELARIIDEEVTEFTTYPEAK